MNFMKISTFNQEFQQYLTILFCLFCSFCIFIPFFKLSCYKTKIYSAVSLVLLAARLIWTDYFTVFLKMPSNNIFLERVVCNQPWYISIFIRSIILLYYFKTNWKNNISCKNWLIRWHSSLVNIIKAWKKISSV